MRSFPKEPTKRVILPLGVMVLVGVVGAALDWSWWLAYAVIAPGAVWLVVRARLVVYRQLGGSPGQFDRRVPVVLVTPIALTAALRPTRYSGLIVVAAFAVVYAFSERARPTGTPSSKEVHGG